MVFNTEGSRQLYERTVGVLIEASSSSSRGPANFGKYPIFMERGRGSRIYDVDGNEYIDWMMAFGALPLGHAHPEVVEAITGAAATGAHFEILTLGNTLFGPSVTTAGLLPGTAVLAALQGRTDLDLVLLPAESVNDDLLFMDDMEAHDLASRLPMPVRLSYDFADALEDGMMERRNDGMGSHSNIPSFHRSGDA